MLLFLKVFFTEFIAEMGDKTQLMLIALTSKYKLKDIPLRWETREERVSRRKKWDFVLLPATLSS